MFEYLVVAVVVLVVVAIVLLVMNGRQLQAFRYEVSYLPRKIQGSQSEKEGQHPLLGQQVGQYVSLPSSLQGQKAVFMVISPVCSSCYKQLEEVLRLHQDAASVPFVCLVTGGDDEYRLFAERYGDTVSALRLADPVRQQMGIMSSPTFFAVKADGTVAEVNGARKFISPHHWRKEVNVNAG